MKKVLNVIGGFFAGILAVALFGLIIAYVMVLNIKTLVNKGGISQILKNVDIVETLKENDEDLWNDFSQLAGDLNLSDEQFEQILKSDKVKEQVAYYISETIELIMTDKQLNLTKEEVTDFINMAVDEYNKVSTKPITQEERNEIINSIDSEVIEEINEGFNSVNLGEIISDDNASLKSFMNFAFVNASNAILLVIVIVVALIALCRFSYYKWMMYAGVSSLMAAILLLIINIGLSSFSLIDIDGELFISIIDVIKSNIYLSVVILVLISIILFVLNGVLKRLDKKQVVAPVTE